MTDAARSLLAEALELLESRSSYSDNDGEEYNDEEVCDWLKRARALGGGEAHDVQARRETTEEIARAIEHPMTIHLMCARLFEGAAKDPLAALVLLHHELAAEVRRLGLKDPPPSSE